MSVEESRSGPMDAQATYMFQRNPNEQGPNGSPRPNNSNNGNGNGGPNKKITRSLIMRSLLIVVVVLFGWGLFQYFTPSSNSGPQDWPAVPYSTVYHQAKLRD